MKNFRKSTVVLFIFLIFVAPAVRADVISLRADDWCPYNCQPDSNAPGFMIEIADVLFKKAGHTINYQIMPWARAIEDGRKGAHNAIVGAARDDAPDFVFPENEQGRVENVFYVLDKETWQYRGIGSLKDRILGAIKNYSYSPEVDQYIQENEKNSKLVQVASGATALESNVKKLLAGRINALVEDKNVMAKYLADTSRNGLIREAGGLSPDNIFIAFSPANPKSAEYAKIISDGMTELRNSGKLKAIMEKYGLEDWK